MKLFDMTREDVSVFEQHLSTIIGAIVIGLLSWLLISVNGLQSTVSVMANEISHINIKLTSLSSDAKSFDTRIDSLERRMERLETNHDNNSKH